MIGYPNKPKKEYIFLSILTKKYFKYEDGRNDNKTYKTYVFINYIIITYIKHK